MPKVYADRHGHNKMRVTFDFDPTIVAVVKEIPGRKFVPKDKGGPCWELPLDLATGRVLRQKFGDNLVLKPSLVEWGQQQVQRENELAGLATATGAKLQRLPDVLPGLWRAMHVGPRGRGLDVPTLDKLIENNPDGSYQSADVAYLANASNPLNGNQPGLGKTLETIGAVFESNMDDGPHLVLAPLTSLESVWKAELEQWQPHPVWLATGSTGQRHDIIWDFLSSEGPGWLICNHHMAQMNREKNDHDGSVKYTPKFPQLYEIEWNTVILDEVHKAGFRDTSSLMYRGVNALTSLKRMALSGTPVGGKPINLWHILHWLEPEEFSNKWRWAEMWLYINDNGYGKEIGRIRKEKEEEFYQYHSPFFLRRLKADVLPDLPPKQEVSIWVEMEGRQKRQYAEMALAAEVEIEDQQLSALGILAQYTRLKQFAISRCTLESYMDAHDEHKVRVLPTEESCKLAALEQLLEERGVLGDDASGDEQVVVFSQFSTVVDMIYSWLEKKKVNVLKLTGATSAQQRLEVQQTFQAGEARVICMTTTAGGVSITLDKADTVIFMDETWDPGDQEQASDRVHRASRIHQVTIYTIRTKESIEDYIMRVLMGKENVNKIILDLRQQGLRADKAA